MTPSATHTHRFAGLDRYAIGLSGLCMVHCLATSVLVALMSTASGFLLDPIFHEVGLTIAIALGALALGRGAWCGCCPPLAAGPSARTAATAGLNAVWGEVGGVPPPGVLHNGRHCQPPDLS